MHFHTWGPFTFDRDQPKQQDRRTRWKANFWNEVAEQEKRYHWEPHELRSAIGCYMFATVKGKSYIPWYIGKTLAQAGFEGEIFQKHKLEHYEAALDAADRQEGRIFLFPLITSSENARFSKAVSGSAATINWLERMLMGMALGKNPKLMNKRDTKMLREVWVEGVFGRPTEGRPTYPAREAKKALL